MIYFITDRIPSIIFKTQLALKIKELKIKLLCSNSLSVISKLKLKILMALKISNLIFKSNKIIRFKLTTRTLTCFINFSN